MSPDVRLFGRLRIAIGEDAWEPPSHLPAALLAYVACQGDWVDRGALASVFWPEAEQSSALTNLRSLLARSKREPFAEGLEVEASRVRWPVWCDVLACQHAVHEERWADAVDLYGAPVLDQMSFDASPAFDAWLHLTRESLKDAYQTAAFHRARDLQANGRASDALAVVRDLLRLEPLDETATQLAMRLQATVQEPAAAARTYRAFAKRLRAELELEPSSATTALLAELERDASAADVSRSAVASVLRNAPFQQSEGGLPPALTPFFGREDEIDSVVTHLAREDCKLVTVTGPGGVGKTRLAAVAAERLRDRYDGGVAFVPLEGVANDGDVATALATTLGFPLRSRERPELQIVRAIGRQRLLLILDNFEHLITATKIVRRLLVACPGLDVLVTSRERLGLPFERLVDLRGLPHPTESVDPNDIDRFPAVALLMSRVRQVRPDVPLDASTIESVVAICRMVQGLPLALELAAVWAKSMPLDQIAQEIGRNLDFLSFGPAATSSRHRSVRAAFEHSWKLLAPLERDAMRKLSVFRGGFRRSAASFVADASIALLAALVDKSLLRVSLEGRYHFHPLISTFALEKLQSDADVERNARRRHAEYLVWLLEQAQPHRGTGRQQTWQERLDPERENVSAAMVFALEKRDADLGAHLVLLLRWLYWPWGFMASRRSLVDRLVALEGEVRTDVKALAFHVAGVLAHTEGDIDAAVGAYASAVRLANPDTVPDVVIRLHVNLGNIERDRGRLDAARDHYVQALALMERAGESPSVANMLNNLATLDRHQDDLETARRRHEHALEIGRALGDPHTLCQTLNGLAYLARDLGRYDEARSLLKESLAISRQHQISSSVIASLDALARASRRSGDLETARRFLREALETLQDTSTYRLLDRCLDSTADLLAASGCAGDAIRIWHAAQADRSSRGASEPRDAPTDRQSLRESTRRGLDEAVLERAAAAGSALDPQAAVEAALRALEQLEIPESADHHR